MANPRPDVPLLLVVSSYAVALLVNLLPLGALSVLLPPIGLLILFYWAQHDLTHTHFTSAVLVGLLYDALLNSLLGLHALLFALVLFVFLRLRRHFRLGHTLQQAILVTLMLFTYQLMEQITHLGSTETFDWKALFTTPLSGLILWPVLKWLLDWLTQTQPSHE